MAPLGLLVLSYLSEHDADAAEIATALGVDVALVEAVCEQLAADGMVGSGNGHGEG